jgi:mono/diheme cytochrome c family protein
MRLVRGPQLSRWFLLVLTLACCRRRSTPDPCFDEPADPVRQAAHFANDAEFRRSCLLRSLGKQQNAYAQDRIARYSPEHWGRLPVATFKTRPVFPSDVGQSPPVPDESWQTIPVGDVPATAAGLKQRGEQMFTRFPAQLERSMLSILRRAGGPARYGLWQTSDSVGGLVWVALPGGVLPALTCSSCHASTDDHGRLRPGVPNHQLDLGKAKDDYVNVRSLFSTWGPGREDIAADGKDNPVVIADLRPVRFQSHLHRTANFRNSLVALALRVETGLITAHAGEFRPEPRDAFALAYYLRSLGSSLDPKAALHHPGRVLFEHHCGGCHRSPDLAGSPIAPERIRSPVANTPNIARGTGGLRVPSLFGVSARRLLLYGGDAKGIDGLLDPARQEGGHPVGQSLTDGERQVIAAYLRAI